MSMSAGPVHGFADKATDRASLRRGLRDGPLVIRTRGCMVNRKMIMAAAVIAGACSVTALGWGRGYG
jgi:hypothetical protein